VHKDTLSPGLTWASACELPDGLVPLLAQRDQQTKSCCAVSRRFRQNQFLRTLSAPSSRIALEEVLSEKGLGKSYGESASGV